MKKKKRFNHFYQSADDIPLVLDSYEDIFTDFDPRSYSFYVGGIWKNVDYFKRTQVLLSFL